MSESPQSAPLNPPDPEPQEPVSDFGTALGCFVIFLVVGVIVLVCVNFLIGLVMFFASQDPNPKGKEGNTPATETITTPEQPAN